MIVWFNGKIYYLFSVFNWCQIEFLLPRHTLQEICQEMVTSLKLFKPATWVRTNLQIPPNRPASITAVFRHHTATAPLYRADWVRQEVTQRKSIRINSQNKTSCEDYWLYLTPQNRQQRNYRASTFMVEAHRWGNKNKLGKSTQSRHFTPLQEFSQCGMKVCGGQNKTV